jgi:selenocysteine lyase/cysteine desulfurase
MLTDQQVSEIRAQFPVLREKVYLYNCSQGALSLAVQAGMDEFACSWRTSEGPWGSWVEKYEQVRVAFAKFINAKPTEVAVVTSASAGINPIANALQFGERRRVVMGEFEFPTMGQIWLAQQARGAQVEFLPASGDTIPLSCYEQAIDRRTMIVPLTHVSFVSGFRSNVTAIARMAHAAGAYIFLDGYQDCGTRPIDVKALDVDFYVTGTLKYLLGPPGLAFLYVREELIERLVSPVTSWMGQREVFAFNPKVLDPAPEARRFEGGSPSIPNIYAALPALDLLTGIGLERVGAQIRKVARAFLEGARAMKISVKTPADSVGPLVVLRSHNPALVSRRLAERTILVSTRLDGIRFAFHVYNNLDDVEAALAVVEESLDMMVRA